MKTSNYSSHPIHSLISQISDIEKNVDIHNASIVNGAQNEFARDKIFSFNNKIKATLEATPDLLISASGLTQLNSYFQAAINELNAFIGNKNPGHIINAANNIDSAIMVYSATFLPSHQPNKEIPIIINGIKSSASSAISSLNAEKENLSNEVEKLRNELDTQKARANELAETLATQKAESLAVTAQVQKEFAEQEAKRSESFSALLGETKESISKNEAATQENAANLIKSLEKNRDDAAKIVQVVGNIGVTGNYQRIAIEEASQADTWRRITIGLFFIGITVAALTFLKFLESTPSPENIFSALVRLFYAVAIASPAWYAAKESARHRMNAEKARQTELELASLGPFIELMPSEKKIEIREQLIDKYFGNNATSESQKETALSSDIKDIAFEVIKAIKK